MSYRAPKELFYASEDKTGIATVEDCFRGIEIQKETLDSKIKKIPQNVPQSMAIANLKKGDLDFDLSTWLKDLRKAKEKNTIVSRLSEDIGYLMVLHGRLTILMNEMTDMDVAKNIDYYRQTLKNNIKMDREHLNMTDSQWRYSTWLETLRDDLKLYKELLQSIGGR